MQEDLDQYLDRRKVAEEMRIMIKHLGWAMNKAANIYNIAKTPDMPSIQPQDLDQYDLFTQLTRREELQNGNDC